MLSAVREAQTLRRDRREERALELIDVAGTLLQLDAAEDGHQSPTGDRNHAWQCPNGYGRDLGTALVAVHDLKGNAQPNPELVELALAAHPAVRDVAQRALGPTEQMADHVAGLAREPAIGVVHTDKLGHCVHRRIVPADGAVPLGSVRQGGERPSAESTLPVDENNAEEDQALDEQRLRDIVDPAEAHAMVASVSLLISWSRECEPTIDLGAAVSMAIRDEIRRRTVLPREPEPHDQDDPKRNREQPKRERSRRLHAAPRIMMRRPTETSQRQLMAT